VILFLDTTVVLRLLTGQPAEQADSARRALAAATAPVHVSDLVIAESYHALRHHYTVPHARAVQALSLLVNSGDVRVPGHAAAVLSDSASRATSPGLVDRLILAECVANAGELLTFDRDLARLPDARLVST
jgi:predicted nucleic acid-binding protein